MKDIDEYTAQELFDELNRRLRQEAKGLCSYCERPRDTPACRFKRRHAGAEEICVVSPIRSPLEMILNAAAISETRFTNGITAQPPDASAGVISSAPTARNSGSGDGGH